MNQNILDKEQARIPVQSQSVEGECKIQQVYCIQYSRMKGILYLIGSFISLGILWVIGYWLPRFKCRLIYSYTSIEICSHFLVLNWDLEWTIVKKEVLTIQIDENKFISCSGMTNRFLRYYFNREEKVIMAQKFPIESSLQRELFINKTQNTFMGIRNENIQALARKCYGDNSIDIPNPSYFSLIFNEVLHPFFLFQLYSVILWIYEEYIYFGTFIILMSAYSLLSDVYLTKQKWKGLTTMCSIPILVQEYISYDTLGCMREISTSKLVQGAIIYIEENLQLPCDCVLLEGDCLVDEEALNGDKVAVVKIKIEQGQQEVSAKHRNTLFEGTTVLQISKSKMDIRSNGLRCLVIATNFSTVKGQLLRSIMYPQPHRFRLFSESIYFLLILGVITILGFLALLPQFLIEHDSIWAITLTLLDSITITIPPTLPAAMNFGIEFALKRLKENKIYCIQPPKIIVGGRLDTVCFDKTGTLTENKMIIQQIIRSPLVTKDSGIIEIQKQFKKGNQLILDGMICCQSLLKVRRENQKIIQMQRSQLNEEVASDLQIVGDAMEVQMFEHAEGDIMNYNDDSQFCQKVIRGSKRQFGIRRKIDFSADTQRMICVAENIESKQNFVFAKGAPEVIKSLSNPDSINNDYDQIYRSLTKMGLRVLALAYKPIIEHELYGRKALEENLIFLRYPFPLAINKSFIVFDNMLKLESPDVIQQLREAKIQCKMITGDNILTAFNVGQSCRFLFNMAPAVFIDTVDERIRIYGNASDEEMIKEDGVVDRVLERVKDSSVILSGSAFDRLFINNPYYDRLRGMNTECDELRFRLYRRLISQSVIFARMKPHQKTLLIQILQLSDRTVGMVGDGGNDSGALHQADVGIDLSETEISIHAPFTSKVLNITSVVIVIRNGRAALASNFQCFKFMVNYSLIQYVSTILLSYQFACLSDMEFLYIDLFIICPLFTTMALTEPYTKLSISRPPSSLFTIQCMVSVFGQVVMSLIGQISLQYMLMQQDFYDRNANSIEFESTGFYLESCIESTTNFVFTNFLYVASMMAFSASKPYKKPFYTNPYFTLCIVLIWGSNVLLTFSPYTRLPNLEFYSEAPTKWLLFVVIYAHIWSIIFYVWENYVCVQLIGKWNQKTKVIIE